MSDRMRLRWLCAPLTAALCVAPLPARSAPAAGGDVAAFEAGFQAGQAQYDTGEFLAAARTWKDAAGKLPATAEQKGNRAALYDYMADAYDKAAKAVEDPAILREGLTALDEYANQFAAAYPGEDMSPRFVEVRERFQAEVEQLDAAEAAARPAEPTTPVEVDTRRSSGGGSWKGLAIGGGVALAGGAAMLGMFAVGYTRTSKYEEDIESPALACESDNLFGKCAVLDEKGRAANSMAVAGLVLAPVLIGAGVGMLVVAMKRKKAATSAFTPQVGRGFVGVQWRLQF